MAQTMINLLVVLVFFGSVANAASFNVNAQQSEVSFLAVGRPSMLKIKGTGAKPTGFFSTGLKTEGEIQVDLREFTTGIATRDKHMKEKYLHTDKPENQFAKFKITSIEMPGNEVPPTGEVLVKIGGTLTLHGKTLPVTSESKLKIEGAKLSTNVLLNLKLTDYGIEIPSFAGVTVAENVDIDIKLEAERSDKK